LTVELAKLADAASAREHDEMMGQIGTNTEEAKNGNMFVSGWRPAVGWICAVGLGYSYVVEPFSSWVATVVFGYAGTFPMLDSSQLYGLVTGMLGFGGLRAYEKVKGVPDSAPLGQPVPSPSPVPTVSTTKAKGLGSKVF